MAHATQLNATEQDTLVKQIGLALLRSAPEDWQSITVEYRAVGKYHELDGEVTFTDGTTREWIATHEVATMFGKLRAGMYRDQRGTWFNAAYQLDAPASYHLDYDREEPRWNVEPPAAAYSDELRMFPRSEENVPEWLMRRLAGLGPERSGPHFRFARVFDGSDPSGRPMVHRAELAPEERDRVLEYLDAAPVVLPGNGMDLDRLAPQPEPAVPIAFHSDGTWIWPAAVNYYLREHGVAPEPDLVAHIRANSFTVGEVSEGQRAAASAYITGNNAQPGPPPRHAPPPPPQAQQAPHSPQAPTTSHATPPPQPPPAPQPPPQEQRGQSELMREQAPNGQPAGAVAGEEPGSGGLAGVAAIDQLVSRLNELGIDPSRYRIGEPARHAWSLEQVASGWRVGWYDERLSNPAVFGDASDAAAFMLGKLLLSEHDTAGGAAAEPRGAGLYGADDESLSTELHGAEPAGTQRQALAAPGPQPPAEQPSAEQPAATQHGEHAAGAPHGAQAPIPEPAQQLSPGSTAVATARPAPGQQWPIQPLPGEPPLTLFRGKELRQLPAGSELDRFGSPDGNLTYAAGTPFEERSLVPEWVHRTYHVYRVQRPIEALTGVAIPWFNQPGGGHAYLLPASVQELLDNGVLIELDPGDPPVD
ncbi:glycohydrolase toxin TNT-related protein [Haloechinothrix sp. LS1_15]|uniref:TNT domain-containing protein n=1 Tax=Haloechinothrix sp. LS1_15 TaxID=2652248 RepID=UPI00294B674E|nr:glycohydrolase toxin TNT-related protein [Haloechinothrix sp. LS1_15]